MQVSTPPAGVQIRAAKPKIFLILTAIFFFTVLFFVNRDNRHAKSKLQVEYEQWLEDLELKQRSGVNLQTPPTVSLRIVPPDGGPAVREMKVAPSTGSDGLNHVIRLLTLAREAEIFASPDIRPGEREGDIIFKVDSPEKSFNAKFPEKLVENNVKLGNFMRLFEEFSKPQVDRPIQVSRASENLEKKAEEEANSLQKEIDDAISRSAGGNQQ